MKRNDFDVKGKKILVVGLGRSGIAACRALVAKKALSSLEIKNIIEEVRSKKISEHK